MNYGMVSYILLQMMRIEGILMALPAMVSLYYSERSGWAFVIIGALMVVASFILGHKKPINKEIFAKEGLVIVGLTWIVWSVFGCLPFVFTGSTPGFIDAFFETVSGFTTTGSTIMTDIESLSKGILFWRSFTHWIGGMGVLVFVMAIMPLAEGRSMYIMRAEVPGPTVGKLVPKTKKTAMILYGIYFGLTVIQTVLLMFGGMSLFDAVLHAFSTAGTGGFSTKNASVAHFNSAYIDGVITVFMFLFGVNFNIFYLMAAKKFKDVRKNEELKAYFAIVVVFTVIITLNTLGTFHSVLKAFRYASFQVVSVITTTGYVTYNYDLWPSLSKFMLLLLMIIGASAGSTGGGLKVSRIIILFKTIFNEIKTMLHPRAVNLISMDGKTIEKETIRSVALYFAAYMVILFISILFVSISNLDFESATTAVLTCFNNTGPGLGAIVGPVENFSSLTGLTKIVLCVDMLLGRLEIFPILLLLYPKTWMNRF